MILPQLSRTDLKASQIAFGKHRKASEIPEIMEF